MIRELLFPRDTVCIACGALRVDVPRWGLCAACHASLVPLTGPFCPRCGREGWRTLCDECATRAPSALDTRAAAFAYDGVARRLVRALKYDCVLLAAEPLAVAMADHLPEGGPDALVPVPLHPLRQRQRGFNQAAVLADALSAHVGLPRMDALARLRNTSTQTALSAGQRHENVRNAFGCILPVTGRTLVLVDDVLTTGATADACASALKAAGAKTVHLLAAALSGPALDA